MQLLIQIVSLAAFVAALTPREILKARQDLPTSDTPTDCTDVCNSFDTLTTNCGSDVTCLCTSTIANALEQCGDCIVSVVPSQQSTFQADADQFVTLCQQAGINVPSITLSPTGSSSNGSSSSPSTSDSLPPLSSPSGLPGSSGAPSPSNTLPATASQSSTPGGGSGNGVGSGVGNGVGNGVPNGTGSGSSGNSGSGSSGTGSSGTGNSGTGSGSGSSKGTSAAASLSVQLALVTFIGFGAAFVLLG